MFCDYTLKMYYLNIKFIFFKYMNKMKATILQPTSENTIAVLCFWLRNKPTPQPNVIV